MKNRITNVENGTSASLVQNGLLAEAKFRPILFSTEMVKAILEGRKTMTRRIIKHHKDTYGGEDVEGLKYINWDCNGNELIQTPKWEIGDCLWVRESMYQSAIGFAMFKAGGKVGEPLEENEYLDWETFSITRKAIPSIHMPKTACRIFLEVTNIRIECLHDISKENAIAEGISIVDYVNSKTQKIPLYHNYQHNIKQDWGFGDMSKTYAFSNPRDSFRTLWQSINGAESWQENPFVWVLSFKQVERPQGFC